MTKEEGYTKLAKLIERFSEQISTYKKSGYNETQTRRDFIDPFFTALGWDVDNSAGNAEAYREVIHEAKVKVKEGASERMKSPDYAFRLPGGKYLFFVEAKSPITFVKEDVIPAYQVRRYGWSAKLAVSITTDFEEFAVYDCTKKPNQGDKASAARIKYLRYDQYLEEFDFLWDTFSKERVLQGSFDKFISNDAARKGTASVDKEFLQSLDKWRTLLATNINQNNHNLDEGELNFAVQQTIDRLIFLRIAEDRGVEVYGTLKKAVKSGTYYKNMVELFKSADEKYNSGLFNFDNDFVTTTMTVSNAAIKDIIIELYYPISPYEFSVLSVEILGSAYEQFLGKQICINAKGKAVIEEKPSVRKAGGVYYTPQYIVDYIVQQTVGALCKGKTPKAVESLTIIDPACGSGSFLLGAYDYLLRYHKDYYTNNPQPVKNRKEKPLTPDGHLTMAVKKQILLNNIYGVDIDLNAVEVTKLSLLLKCLEGETTASIEEQTTLWGGSILPTLDGNVKSGNSLIGPDFYDESINSEEATTIKPFNWQKSFAKVFKNRGFDAVIGNPPYLRVQGLHENQPDAMNYYKKFYKAAESGNFDIYVLFDEKGFKLLKDGGMLGFIQPHKFFQADFGEGIRNFFVEENALFKIINFGAHQVFADATTYTCLLFLKKGKQKEIEISTVSDLKEWAADNQRMETFKSAQPLKDTKWNFSSEVKQSISKKLAQQEKTLGDITRKIFVGLQTSSDKIYVLQHISENENTITCFSNSLDGEVTIEKGLLKPFLMGKDVKRYEVLKPKNVVIFPYLVKNGKAEVMSQDFIKSNFPLGWKYILKNREELENREKGKMKVENFYAYIYPKNLVEFEFEKISTPDIASKPQFTIDLKKNSYHTTTVYSFVFKNEIEESQKYFLGVLNSNLLWYFLNTTGNVLRGGFFRFKTEYLKPFPIKTIDYKNSKEKAHHDDIVRHVENLLKLHAEKQTVTLATRRESIEDRIEHSEWKINDIVYALYGITDEERAVIEG